LLALALATGAGCGHQLDSQDVSKSWDRQVSKHYGKVLKADKPSCDGRGSTFDCWSQVYDPATDQTKSVIGTVALKGDKANFNMKVAS
jgi:hypothetical protein